MSRLSFEPGSSTVYRTGDWRIQRPVYQDKWPPCGEGCPAHEDIRAYLALVNDGRHEAAWRKLTEQNPFPGVCGRICPHPCEGACNRGHLDEAVAIHHVERHLGDLALADGWRHTPQAAPVGKRVGIVGAGPAGLTCAYYLARHGYPVTVFDAASEPGGTLRWGVPDYRLPKAVLSQEIDAILALGVELHLDTRIGTDVGAGELRARYDAVFLAVGALAPHTPVEGDVSGHGVEHGVEFLRRVNAGERPVLPARVAVVGAGNTAVDVARCARRLGAAEVTIVSPQDRPGSRPGEPAEEMTASPAELAQAEAEGVRLLLRRGVQRLVRSGQHLNGLQVAEVDHVFDDGGRFMPALYEGTETFLAAERVIVAIGQEPDWRGLESLRPDPAKGVFVGGDAGGAARTAATAIGSGHEAADAIMAYLEGRLWVASPRPSPLPFDALHPQYYRRERRSRETQADPAVRLLDFAEVAEGLDAAGAAYEAGRCLNCGACLECDNCWHFCPDAAVIKLGPGNRYEYDYEYCKGCGICAQECPSGHIHMEPEPTSP
jgi:2-oxoacid:acceptor oxidoreductase delta subunit (pyruvate/2-ketoisovalerate family)